MPVSIEAEKALPRFVELIAQDGDLQDRFNSVDDINSLRNLILSVEPLLTGAALIPLEQSTRPPKILVECVLTRQKSPCCFLRRT